MAASTESLTSKFPEIAAEWDEVENGSLTPDRVSPGSNKKVHWRCRKAGHRWEAVIGSRTRQGTGCPVCSGRQAITGVNDLMSKFPAIAAEWDDENNGSLTPDQFLPGSNKKVHWRCRAFGHQWEAVIVSRTRQGGGGGCPVCAGKKVVAGFNDLASQFPEIAAEWDDEKNGARRPDEVTTGSQSKAHWRCRALGHQWEAAIGKRTRRGDGCPVCSGRQVVPGVNDLASQFPEIAAEWDDARNGDLTPDQVVAGNGKKAHWKCREFGHQWEAVIVSRTRQGVGCPVCAGKKVSAGVNDLASKFPEIAAEWDAEKNGNLTPDQVTAGSHSKVHWKCRAFGHQWHASIEKRTRQGRGCPVCSNNKVQPGYNDLASKFPEIAAEWDAEKNGNLTPGQVVAGGDSTVHWKCRAYGHQWKTKIAERTSGGYGCPVCAGNKVQAGFNDLATKFPEVAAEWDDEKNGARGPHEVTAKSRKKAHWKCREAGHQWEASIANRTRLGRGCPVCSGLQVQVGVNDLASQFPEIAAEWDYVKNAPLTPQDVTARSGSERHWLCSNGHKYTLQVERRTSPINPTGCHCQLQRWTGRRLDGFVADLAAYTVEMTPAMRYAVCQQAGVLTSTKSDVIGRILSDPTLLPSSLPTDDADSIDDGSGSSVPAQSEMEEGDLDELDPESHLPTPDDVASATADAEGTADEQAPDADSGTLPNLDVNHLLGMGEKFFASVDEDTADFLTAAAAAQLWKAAYRLDSAALSKDEQDTLQVELDKTLTPRTDEYAERIRCRFRSEYDQALALVPPANWSFRPEAGGDIVLPNLMQRHVATQVVTRKRVGNWSGTGAGKTVSAILAAGLLEAGQADGIVLVICPNNVVPGWISSVRNCYPDARIASKTLTPIWAPGSGPRWLVVNYDRLPGNEGTIKQLIDENPIDMLVIDEVHYVKERENVAPSQRRGVLAAITVEAARSNADLAVLGMSATPVVNDLHEARSLLELIEGVKLDDIATAKTVPNAMRVHQYLTRLGSRWMPDYSAQLEAVTVPLDVTHHLGDILALGKHPTPAALDQTLLTDKLDTIIDSCRSARKALIYTQFVTGVVEPLTEALNAAGLRVGLFTGDDKDGYSRFVGTWPNGDTVSDEDRVDVLIGSEAISTGVDGLQHVCDTLIFATLPWTHANYQQIVGRIHRQGQASTAVKVVIPATFADITTAEGEEKQWSWCGQRWARVEMKESLSDCAVDGVVPKGVLVSPTEAARASLEWLRRLKEGGLQTATRVPLDRLLGEDIERMSSVAKRRRYGDLTTMHGAWASTNSAVTHSRLAENPAEWRRYHDLYTEARRKWETVPAYEFAKWLNDGRRPCVVADLGCGEMLLADRVTSGHTILPFDHVAFDDRVTVCDIAAVPLDDASVDIAILSLALMGKNHADYVREAHRILPVDGHLWLCEPTSSIGSDETRLKNVLADFGFDLYRVQVAGQFTFIRALKSDNTPNDVSAPIKIPSQ
ncbi:zinc-ribbon domain-containing protein [Rhodococcus wratislaviensis]|uniref:zinc-ribbon domain-containing protein n=1 Tax=Rhodococcus wratislaviensis TaxID=44752 RepID=UPI003518FADF